MHRVISQFPSPGFRHWSPTPTPAPLSVLPIPKFTLLRLIVLLERFTDFVNSTEPAWYSQTTFCYSKTGTSAKLRIKSSCRSYLREIVNISENLQYPFTVIVTRWKRVKDSYSRPTKESGTKRRIWMGVLQIIWNLTVKLGYGIHICAAKSSTSNCSYPEKNRPSSYDLFYSFFMEKL